MYYGPMLGPSRRVSRRQQEPRYALYFDGVDDYGDLGTSRIYYDGGSVGLFADANEQWTVEFWVRPYSVSSELQCLGLAKSENPLSVTRRLFCVLYSTTSSYQPLIYVRRGPTLFRDWQKVDLWTHYALIWDGEQASLVFNRQTPVLLETDTINDQDVNILVGAVGAASPMYFFHGLKRDLRIWNHARTYEQIMINMNRTLKGTEPGLIGYWPLNEGQGSVAHDLTEQQNDMIIHGATWVGV